MNRTLETEASIAALPKAAQVETERQNRFVSEIQRRGVTLQAHDGCDFAKSRQVYRCVTAVTGATPVQADFKVPKPFAAKAGCRNGLAPDTLVAGVTATAAEFDVLCRGGQ